MEFDQFKIKFSSIWHASNRKSTMRWPFLSLSIVFKEPSNVYGDKKGSRMSSCVIDDSAKKCSTINNGFCHFMSPQEEEKGHKMKSCLWTLFQFNQSLPFSRKFILNWLYHSCTYKNCVKSTLCWVEARSVFTEKAKLWKITRNSIISLFHEKKKKSNTFWRKFLTSSIELSGFQLSRPRNIIFFNRQITNLGIHTFN